MSSGSYESYGMRTGRLRFIESFNGRLRDECLNVHLFFGLRDAREKLENWRTDYNQVRPHGSLSNMTPREFAEANGKARPPTAPDPSHWPETNNQGAMADAKC